MKKTTFDDDKLLTTNERAQHPHDLAKLAIWAEQKSALFLVDQFATSPLISCSLIS